MCLAYGLPVYTHDIDILNTENLKFIEDVCRVAKEKTGLNIPVNEVTVFDVPFDYEDRLVRV